MSEPRNRAERVTELTPGLQHWSIHDERIDFRSEAYAVRVGERWFLVDPLPLAPGARDSLARPDAILITGGFHQRSAWTYRELYGAPVLAPRSATGLEAPPDGDLTDRQEIVSDGGLVALDRPGPTEPHFVFLARLERGMRVLFCGDLLMRGDDGPFGLVPAEHRLRPDRLRQSVDSLERLEFDWLCPAHGRPETRAQMRQFTV